MLNTHCACRKATLYFLPAIAAIAEALVTDIVTDVLIHFPIIAQRSKVGGCVGFNVPLDTFGTYINHIPMACTTFIELLVLW